CGEHDSRRRFSEFVGQRKSVSSRLRTWEGRGLPAIGELANDTAIHQRQLAPRHAFSIEWSASLSGVPRVVGDGDILAENLLSNAVVQKAAAIADGGGAEVGEHLACQIEHCCRLQDDGVPA